MSEFITVRIPRDHWDQIVSDIENMCGTHKDDIEILQDAWVVEDVDDDLNAPEFDALMESAEPVRVEVKLNRKGMSQFPWWNEMSEREKFEYQHPDFEG